MQRKDSAGVWLITLCVTKHCGEKQGWQCQKLEEQRQAGLITNVIEHLQLVMTAKMKINDDLYLVPL